jgi:transcriptional regulator with XRE-family HTH domain
MQPLRLKSPSLSLRSFLRERRTQVRPEAVGLPMRKSRSTLGLRREDVAELLGVTPLWYSLFESGTSRRRFSGSFLERVQDVLQLDASDRAMFLNLVVCGGHAAADVEARWYALRYQTIFDTVAEFAATLEGTSNIERAMELAHARLHGLLSEMREFA